MRNLIVATLLLIPVTVAAQTGGTPAIENAKLEKKGLTQSLTAEARAWAAQLDECRNHSKSVRQREVARGERPVSLPRMTAV